MDAMASEIELYEVTTFSFLSDDPKFLFSYLSEHK